jgi:hypothetical protein
VGNQGNYFDATLPGTPLGDLCAIGACGLLNTSADIDVTPVILLFGDVEVGLFCSDVVTVTNLGLMDLTLTGIELIPGSGGDFTIDSVPPLPATLSLHDTVDIEVTFTPVGEGTATAVLQILSNDPDQGSIEVMLGGEGVLLDPSDILGTILDFFDASVLDGTLVGNGPGPWAEKRLNALRNKLEAAGDLIDAGRVIRACNKLLDAYLRTDGVWLPPDFAAGPAAPELATQIQALRATLGCEVWCGDVDRSGSVGPGDTDRARDYLLRVTPEPPFELVRCSVSGAARACDIGDVVRIRRWIAGLPVMLENLCQMATAGGSEP